MITINVIRRVFRLKYKTSVGTCFSIDVGGRQYLVTARHVLQLRDDTGKIVGEFKDGETIDLFHDGYWKSQAGELIGHSDIADVSVFAISEQVSAHPLDPTMDKISYGQDVYFLGFPYGLKSEIGAINNNFPVPIVKKGILSAMLSQEPGKPFLVDGHNNPGFSGGPVVFKQLHTQDFKVAGVIHGYQPEYEERSGALVPIQNTNSGIICVYSIDNALDLIKDYCSMR